MTIKQRILAQYEIAYRANIFLSDGDLRFQVNNDGGKRVECVARRAREARNENPFDEKWEKNKYGWGMARYKVYKLNPSYFSGQMRMAV